MSPHTDLSARCSNGPQQQMQLWRTYHVYPSPFPPACPRLPVPYRSAPASQLRRVQLLPPRSRYFTRFNAPDVRLLQQPLPWLCQDDCWCQTMFCKCWGTCSHPQHLCATARQLFHISHCFNEGSRAPISCPCTFPCASYQDPPSCYCLSIYEADVTSTQPMCWRVDCVLFVCALLFYACVGSLGPV